MKLTRVLSPPGSVPSSMILLIVEAAKYKYPLSTACFETSNTNTYVGGMGGLFEYSIDATKSTVPLFSSGFSYKSCLYPLASSGE